MPFDSIGKLLVVFGIGIVIIGVVFILGLRLPFLGHLPGDLAYERDGMRVYFPIATSIILSIVLTVVLNLVFGLFSRR